MISPMEAPKINVQIAYVVKVYLFTLSGLMNVAMGVDHRSLGDSLNQPYNVLSFSACLTLDLVYGMRYRSTRFALLSAGYLNLKTYASVEK